MDSHPCMKCGDQACTVGQPYCEPCETIYQTKKWSTQRDPKPMTLVDLIKIFHESDSERELIITRDYNTIPVQVVFRARAVVELTDDGKIIIQKNGISEHKGEIEMGR